MSLGVFAAAAFLQYWDSSLFQVVLLSEVEMYDRSKAYSGTVWGNWVPDDMAQFLCKLSSDGSQAVFRVTAALLAVFSSASVAGYMKMRGEKC